MDIFKQIRQIQIRTLREVKDLFAGDYHSVFKGQGMAFEEVREYEPGDEIRHIDWNVTARMQRPFIKKFREERELTVMLVVDVSSSCQFATKTRLKSEIIAEIGALLAFSAIKNQDNVGLLLFTDEVELFIRPGKTIRHVLRIIRELLYFKPKHKKTNFNEALSYLDKVQRKSCICFLISDFLTPHFGHEFDITAKKHDLIAVQVFDPAEKTLPKCGIINIRDLESEKELLVDSNDPQIQSHFKSEYDKRNKHFDKTIGRLGIDSIKIDTKLPYINPLRQFFKMRRARR